MSGFLTTHTPFNCSLSGTTRVCRYQKGKTKLDFTEARDSEWHWHPLGHMQVCISLQADNYASTQPLSFLQAGCPSCRPTSSVKALKAWVLNKAGVKRELLDTVRAKKASILWSHHEETREKEIMQGTMAGARRRGRPHAAWMDNMKTWTGLSVDESIRMTEDRDKWSKYVHGVANPRIEDG